MHNAPFLAPSGAQGVTISVRSFVRIVLTCLELSIFNFLAQVVLRSLSGLFQVSLFVIQSEPKILCLVFDRVRKTLTLSVSPLSNVSPAGLQPQACVFRGILWVMGCGLAHGGPSHHWPIRTL